MPDGDLLQVIYARSYRLDTKTWQWTDLPNLPAGSNGAGSAGLLLPGGPKGSNRVLMIGGLKSQGAGVPAEAVKTTAKYNYAKPGADWTSGHAMPTARAHMNVVQVPNGSAYGIGGNTTGLSDGGQFQTMKYSPGSDTWTNMAVQKPRRAYHSTALLLPDGRIMSAGDDKAGGGGQRIDFYKPPYLFKGPRPKISDAPKQVSYKKKAFRIGTAGKRATRAVLMAPAATTHANDMNARHVELAVRRVGGGFRARTPGRTVAPPGYYMLFTVTAGGVPSVAKWVHLG